MLFGFELYDNDIMHRNFKFSKDNKTFEILIFKLYVCTHLNMYIFKFSKHELQ
jgi:hypothetical protein